MTLGSLAYGVLGGMGIGLVLALASVWWQAPGSDLVPAVLSGLSLALPAALIALVFLWMGGGGRWAIAASGSPGSRISN